MLVPGVVEPKWYTRGACTEKPSSTSAGRSMHNADTRDGAALPGEDGDLGPGSKGVLLVAVELRAEDLGQPRQQLQLNPLACLHFEAQLRLLLQLEPHPTPSRASRPACSFLSRLLRTICCHHLRSNVG
ncbi:hypothetical protein JZ751_008740 [Albula glossodonta]|uniref:Uncharacterized protein n=1 Tax=Albula glossodonta TaxID=121402 RepID=A0A8T2P1H7_9TELE|nr:hypothetical protein JZ751_008740 [Albula glossodonta]